ncbi:uncharacterized protein IL334_005766 [Kwoniella shivajii]|uniref:FAD/NAD(P)-binding domain-containing protein n=1 Tax=Kwoniella shivajii TaxID=564305 RepID=A0ABZ1D415_9TREE|nr:hypothetical protein IL334_005766 [Kwoniella shivajii]
MTIALKPRLLIIGCGPAKDFDVVAYEARDSVGGLWNFDPNPPPCKVTFDDDGHAIALTGLEQEGNPSPSPTPMYAGVTANTPRVVEYPTHQTIFQYQQEHAVRYLDYIRFNRVVTRVRHAPKGRSSVKKWLVEWTPSLKDKSQDLGKAFEEQFDHVVVANGTDSRPFIPYIDGLWDWKGEIFHSRWYRRPQDFAGKTVMVVGGGPSSADIVRELGMLCVRKSTSASKKIYRSFRSKLRYDTEHDRGWPDHIVNVSPMRLVSKPSPQSHNGRIVIVFATGFVARFEFFRETDAPFDQAPLLRYPQVPKGARRPSREAVGKHTLEGGHRVHNLDAHQIFYLPDPTLAFLLLHAEAIPWPFSEMQARVVAAHWSGTPLDLDPHPDEDNDSHSILILGHPGEFEYAEKMLKLIGEGGPQEIRALID